MDSFHAVKKIPSMSFARKVKITSRGQILTSYFIALIEITIEIFSLNHLMWGEFQFTNSFFQNFTCNNKIFQISRKKQNDMVILVNDNISAPLNDTFHFIQTTCPTNTPEASLFYLFSLPPSPALNLLYIITMYFICLLPIYAFINNVFLHIRWTLCHLLTFLSQYFIFLRFTSIIYVFFI